MDITTTYSLWLLPLCLVLGVAYAWALYGKLPEGKPTGGQVPRGVMAALRAVLVAFLAFLLLGPMLRVLVREQRLPVVVVAHDGSASLLAAGDTVAMRTTYPERLQALAKALEGRYTVRTFTYGERVRDGLDHASIDTRTDMDALFRTVQDRFGGADLGAVVIDGDGIYNRGRDPLLSAERLSVPVFTIPLGDTLLRPDLLVRAVDHNRVSYLGNAFPVRVRVQAHHMQGVRSRVSVLHDGREVAGQDITVPDADHILEVDLSVKAERTGLQRYTAVVRPVEGELRTENNRMGFTIDVLDDRRKVLIMARAPHPDVAAIRAALDAVEGYEVRVAFADAGEPTLDGIDLLVLHGMPASGRVASASLLQRITGGDLPVLQVVDGRTDVAAVRAFGVDMLPGGSGKVDAAPGVAQGQGAFNLSPEDVRTIERFPPLQVPFGQYGVGRDAQVLVKQRIGPVVTEQPLIAYRNRVGQRSLVVTGEGLWRWRLADQRMNGGTQCFDGLIQRFAQFLTSDASKQRFKVVDPPELTQGDIVELRAELYDPAFEPVNDVEVQLRLRSEDGKVTDHAFVPSGSGYALIIGRLEPGHYTWTASTTQDGTRLQDAGELVVNAVVVERISTVADHALMARLAARTGGAVLSVDDPEQVLAALDARPGLHARSYSHATFNDLVSLPWVLALLLLLLCTEWVLRRWNGGY